jgi:hypothetical protein
VIDSAGNEIGKVDDLMIDERERKVRFVEVAAGGLPGLGETKVLLPVEAVSSIEKDGVRTNHSRERVIGAPRYDPRLVKQPYLSELYGYYGYQPPFWDAAYAYPRYPDL